MRKLGFVFLLILLNSCNPNEKNDKENRKDFIIDSLKSVIESEESEMKWLKRNNPGVIIANQEASTCAINLFFPVGLKIKIVDKKPEFNEKTFFSVAGAYTSKSGNIDGLFINNGEKVQNVYNNTLTGVCILNKDSILIESSTTINDVLIKRVISEKSSLFQQTLLIKNGEIVNCNLFGNAINLRRALIKFNDGTYLVGESHRAMTIFEFQNALKEIGTLDAVNLDMGSWSEGWHKINNERITIGENFINTHRQTNWIIYSLE